MLISINRILKASDEDLVVMLSGRHRNKAIEELYNRYAQRVLNYFNKMLQGDIQRAQDLTQDVFIKVMEKSHQFNPEKKFYTWMFTIASNHAKSSFRGKIKEVDFTKTASKTQQENTYDNKLFKQEFEKAIHKLNTRHREVYVLRYIEKLSVPQIAEIVDLPEGTIKSRLFHANKLMVDYLREFDPKKKNYGAIK